jgi:hypothetical protein
VSVPYEKRNIPRYTGPCAACNEVFTGHYARRICDKCRPGAYRLCQQANSKVQQAIKSGKMEDPWEANLQCADCGGRASLWEHRDYAKPFDVEPVCYRCNIKRGPGKRSLGVPTETLPSIARHLAKRKPLP